MITDVYNKYVSHLNTPFKMQRRLHWEEVKLRAENLALLVLIFFEYCHVTFNRKREAGS
jgi:hypothetical protein